MVFPAPVAFVTDASPAEVGPAPSRWADDWDVGLPQQTNEARARAKPAECFICPVPGEMPIGATADTCESILLRYAI
jgi:hypothetical protein